MPDIADTATRSAPADMYLPFLRAATPFALRRLARRRRAIRRLSTAMPQCRQKAGASRAEYREITDTDAQGRFSPIGEMGYYQYMPSLYKH